MKPNTDGLLELKLGRFGKPFIPDEYGEVGMLIGENEVTELDDIVRGFRPSSFVFIVEYEYKGKYVKDYYRRGKWMHGTDNRPRFVAWGLLR